MEKQRSNDMLTSNGSRGAVVDLTQSQNLSDGTKNSLTDGLISKINEYYCLSLKR